MYKISEMPERERPVNRIREVGTQAVSTAELLACIFQTGDALHQANEVLREFGGLEGLASADLHRLKAIRGIGDARAAQLIAAIELGRRMAALDAEERWQITNPGDVALLLSSMIGHKEQECFVVLFLDTRNRVIDKTVLYQGTVNTSLVRIAEVFREAVRRNSTSVVVAHNHPSGDPAPSPEDIALTRRLVEAGKVVEVAVLDHLVIGHNRYVSLRERNLGFEEA